MRFSNFNRRARGRVRLAIFVTCVSAGLISLVLAPDRTSFLPGTSAADTPVLLTQAGSTRAIALDSVTRLAEPFQLQSPIAFGSDARTRLILFATNLTLAAGENASAVAAEAEDFTHARYPMTVEYVGAVPGQTWMTAVIVRLNDNLGEVGVRQRLLPLPAPHPILDRAPASTASGRSHPIIRGTRTFQPRRSIQTLPT